MARDVFRAPKATVHETGFEIQEPSRRAEVTPNTSSMQQKQLQFQALALHGNLLPFFWIHSSSHRFEQKFWLCASAMAPLGAVLSLTIYRTRAGH